MTSPRKCCPVWIADAVQLHESLDRGSEAQRDATERIATLHLIDSLPLVHSTLIHRLRVSWFRFLVRRICCLSGGRR